MKGVRESPSIPIGHTQMNGTRTKLEGFLFWWLTFGFMKDLKMMNELGLGSGGRLDNFILVGEDDIINTELRFPDEFVRHNILDIVGEPFTDCMRTVCEDLMPPNALRFYEAVWAPFSSKHFFNLCKQGCSRVGP